MSKLRIAVSGVGGRMGRALVESIENNPDTQLTGAIEHSQSPLLGQDAGAMIGKANQIKITSDINLALENVDAVIDFSRPEGSLKLVKICAERHIPIIIGTTGLSDDDKNILKTAAEQTVVVFASNFSVSVNLMFTLLDTAAKILNKGYDIEIIEAHHKHKVDSPSGTALRLGEVIANALNRDLKQCAVYGREGFVGERDENTIGFATVRGGDIVGDHTVMFAGIGERFEISHKASSRMNFANGAVRAALWAKEQDYGFYDMQDVLGLRS